MDVGPEKTSFVYISQIQCQIQETRNVGFCRIDYVCPSSPMTFFGQYFTPCTTQLVVLLPTTLELRRIDLESNIVSVLNLKAQIERERNTIDRNKLHTHRMTVEPSVR